MGQQFLSILRGLYTSNQTHPRVFSQQWKARGVAPSAPPLSPPRAIWWNTLRRDEVNRSPSRRAKEAQS